MRMRLRELREGRGLSQNEVAKLTEVDISTVSRHESGERLPDKLSLQRYARLYKCETYELFGEIFDAMQDGHEQTPA